jgi:hypothetical protein
VKWMLPMTAKAGDSGAGSNAGPILFGGRQFLLELAHGGGPPTRSGSGGGAGTAWHGATLEAHRIKERDCFLINHRLWESDLRSLAPGRLCPTTTRCAAGACAPGFAAWPAPGRPFCPATAPLRGKLGEERRPYFFSISWPRMAPPGNSALWMLT